jgi:hypothetical protein
MFANTPKVRLNSPIVQNVHWSPEWNWSMIVQKSTPLIRVDFGQSLGLSFGHYFVVNTVNEVNI